MKAYIKELLTQVFTEMYPGEAPEILDTVSLDISYPRAEFGDYASNAALITFKQFKPLPAKDPKAFAEALAKKITALDHKQIFQEVSAVGGFINFRLKHSVLARQVINLTQTIPIDQIGAGQKVVFEYSSPNTNKPLHIGHTRNDLYGLACIRLLKAAGYEVMACEIINDRGIHIMKSILMYMKYGEGKNPESENMKPDHFVGKFYEMFATQAAHSPEQEKVLLEEVQDLLRKWEAGDPELRHIWQQMNQWFFEGVKQTYAAEGSYFDEVDYESRIYDKGKELVLRGAEQGIFQKEPDGSVSADLSDYNLGKKYLLRKDGTTLYITQDLYLWDLRNQRHHPDLALVTTSAEQAYHFAVLARLFELVGYPWAVNFRHLPYEHVYLGNNKMSSREGNAITADELLISVKARVREAMSGLEKIKASADNDALIQAVAYGAIKYGYLKYEPNTRIYFDIGRTISLEGNTGPYLQYAHARISSILKKSGDFTGASPDKLNEPAEVGLMRLLIHYGESVISAGADYKPNLLCNYLYNLAATFNTLYNDVPILQAEDEETKNQRLTLLSATANVFRHGLGLLGIEAPEEM